MYTTIKQFADKYDLEYSVFSCGTGSVYHTFSKPNPDFPLENITVRVRVSDHAPNPHRVHVPPFICFNGDLSKVDRFLSDFANNLITEDDYGLFNY